MQITQLCNIISYTVSNPTWCRTFTSLYRLTLGVFARALPSFRSWVTRSITTLSVDSLESRLSIRAATMSNYLKLHCWYKRFCMSCDITKILAFSTNPVFEVLLCFKSLTVAIIASAEHCQKKEKIIVKWIALIFKVFKVSYKFENNVKENKFKWIFKQITILNSTPFCIDTLINKQ